jgi:hypothetical protein
MEAATRFGSPLLAMYLRAKSYTTEWIPPPSQLLDRLTNPFWALSFKIDAALYEGGIAESRALIESSASTSERYGHGTEHRSCEMSQAEYDNLPATSAMFQINQHIYSQMGGLLVAGSDGNGCFLRTHVYDDGLQVKNGKVLGSHCLHYDLNLIGGVKGPRRGFQPPMPGEKSLRVREGTLVYTFGGQCRLQPWIVSSSIQGAGSVLIHPSGLANTVSVLYFDAARNYLSAHGVEQVRSFPKLTYDRDADPRVAWSQGVAFLNGFASSDPNKVQEKLHTLGAMSVTPGQEEHEVWL